MSALSAISRRAKGKSLPAEFGRFTTAFNSFAMQTLFAPLVKAGQEVDRHGRAFSTHLLTDQNSEQKAVQRRILREAIPHAQRTIESITSGFIRRMPLLALAEAVTQRLDFLRGWYHDKAQEWRSTLEADNVPSITMAVQPASFQQQWAPTQQPPQSPQDVKRCPQERPRRP